jgi:demethylmenaquinone methyltransferase/2-methoxy-6-polyprenyl-1,4-benzoquinol methylase
MVARAMKQSPTKPQNREESRTHFGFHEVAEGDKQGLVNEVFAKVAERYDVMNDLMSAGLHRAWKAAMVDWLAPPKSDRDYRVLDVAGGTGDIAFRLVAAAGRGTRVTVCDINEAMLAVGRARAVKGGHDHACRFVTGNAEDLPFPDKNFDAYTIAFGIRNVTHIERALAEAYRVLKPGGRFLCLEFSTVDLPGLDALYDAYSFTAIPAIGKAVTGDGAAYRYLVESIRKFPDQGKFARMIADAGFARVSHRSLSGGIVALHSGWRI